MHAPERREVYQEPELDKSDADEPTHSAHEAVVLPPPTPPPSQYNTSKVPAGLLPTDTKVVFFRRPIVDGRVGPQELSPVTDAAALFKLNERLRYWRGYRIRDVDSGTLRVFDRGFCANNQFFVKTHGDSEQDTQIYRWYRPHEGGADDFKLATREEEELIAYSQKWTPKFVRVNNQVVAAHIVSEMPLAGDFFSVYELDQPLPPSASPPPAMSSSGSRGLGLSEEVTMTTAEHKHARAHTHTLARARR